MAPPQAKKKSQGRKKIEMKVIENDSARTVAFSKRRLGLFRKATELSVLCGARIALIIFSLCGRAYSFGHPSVKSVFDSFFNSNLVSNLPGCSHGPEDHTAVNMKQLKDECDEKSAELVTKKKRRKEIEAALESSMLSKERVDMLNLHQLKHLKETMERLKANMHRLLPTTSQMVSREPVLSSIDVAGPLNRETVVLDTARRDGKEACPTPPVWLKPNIDLNVVEYCGSASEDGSNAGDAANVPSVCLSPKAIGQTTVERVSPVWFKPKKVDLANVGKVAGNATPIPPDWLSLRSDYHGLMFK